MDPTQMNSKTYTVYFQHNFSGNIIYPGEENIGAYHAEKDTGDYVFYPNEEHVICCEDDWVLELGAGVRVQVGDKQYTIGYPNEENKNCYPVVNISSSTLYRKNNDRAPTKPLKASQRVLVDRGTDITLPVGTVLHDSRVDMVFKLCSDVECTLI